jgi:hypothetical protein
MKKFVLLVAFALFVFNSNAQDRPTKDPYALTIGIIAGVNFASLTGDNTNNQSSLTGFHAGAVVDIPFADGFSVQPGLVYSAQGAEYEDSEEDGISYDGKFKLDYLNVPLIVKYEVADGFTLEAGPQIGFNISAKDEYESPEDSGEEDIEDFKSIDFAASVGLGYTMASGLNIGARYNIGLTELDDSDVEPENWKNGVVQISIGYFF